MMQLAPTRHAIWGFQNAVQIASSRRGAAQTAGVLAGCQERETLQQGNFDSQGNGRASSGNTRKQ